MALTQYWLIQGIANVLFVVFLSDSFDLSESMLKQHETMQ
jgi:hypothetical protein